MIYFCLNPKQHLKINLHSDQHQVNANPKQQHGMIREKEKSKQRINVSIPDGLID